MIRTILTLALVGAAGVGGWLGGSAYPAPPEWIEAINKEAGTLSTKLNLESTNFASLRSMMSEQKFTQIKTEMADLAVARGEVIPVEQDVGTVEDQLNNLAIAAPAPTPAAPPPAPAPGTTPATPAAPAAALAPAASSPFEKVLLLCPRMTIQNKPASNVKLEVMKYAPLVNVKGVKIATFPSRGACMSSGYGPRDSRQHKGVDYHSETGAPILAAGDGTIIEMKYRDDYGNMLLIDHGGGVYTRYAHLASFGKGLMVGVTVAAGENIGLMGNTAGYQIPMHLHYELLLGDYANPKASFGLEPADPLTFPAAT